MFYACCQSHLSFCLYFHLHVLLEKLWISYLLVFQGERQLFQKGKGNREQWLSPLNNFCIYKRFFIKQVELYFSLFFKWNCIFFIILILLYLFSHIIFYYFCKSPRSSLYFCDSKLHVSYYWILFFIWLFLIKLNWTDMTKKHTSYWKY